MVLESRIQRWTRRAVLIFVLASASTATADVEKGKEYLQSARKLYERGQYFSAARYAFSAAQEDASLKPDAYAYVTLGLSRAGMYHSAAYFFLQTLATEDKNAIRRVLTRSQAILEHVGLDLVRSHLIEYTQAQDYDAQNRGAYLFAMGKRALLQGDLAQAVSFLGQIDKGNSLYPFALQARATAHAIEGRDEAALDDFRQCLSRADAIVDRAQSRDDYEDNRWLKQMKIQAEDLSARCQAGIARVQYQMRNFEEADQSYGQVPKASFVWTDILFEHAWSSFSRGEYNRALGALVTYKSPDVSFVFNSEIDVLRAQSFLALCLYDDANKVINEFNAKYASVGGQVKNFLQSSPRDLTRFYEVGERTLNARLHTRQDFYRLMNRFVRSPYFQNLVSNERGVERERRMISRFAQGQEQGFPAFLQQVLKWRKKSVQLLGGAFVKNSLLDYYSTLLSDFDKVAFIKLEMLKRAKEQLATGKAQSYGRGRGNIEPSRRDDQYYWSFNGEFWSDEIGDYVFGLESECH